MKIVASIFSFSSGWNGKTASRQPSCIQCITPRWRKIGTAFRDLFRPVSLAGFHRSDRVRKRLAIVRTESRHRVRVDTVFRPRDVLCFALLLVGMAVAVPEAASAQGICSRTEGVHNHIVMKLKDIHGFKGTCSDVTAADLAKLTYIEIFGGVEGQNLSSLKRGDFAGLTNVTSIELFDQLNLRSLPSNAFEGLTNVEDMWILPSGIERISAGAFRGLSKLKKIHIVGDETNYPGGNQLSYLAPGAFNGLTSLEMLNIGDHTLGTLPLEELEALRPTPGSLEFYEGRTDGNDSMKLRVTPTALTIPAGESKTYRIGLMSRSQVYTKITFNVPEGLTVSPTEVVFPYNHPDWFRLNEITVTVNEDTSPGTLTISHNDYMHNWHELDEPAPAVTITVPGAVSQSSLSIADASGYEGDTLDFDVTLSKASSHTVTVEWDTRGGTATEDVDFTGDLGTLTFRPNETEKTISIVTLEDQIDDSGEQFTVVLSNPSRATLADGSAIGTINNTSQLSVPGNAITADSDPAISIADDRVTEGATLEFTVTLSQESSDTVTVDWETREGTADEDVDYVGDSGILSFAPGDTVMSVRVATIDDDHNDDAETVSVVLSNASGATIADGTGVGVIDNHDLLPGNWIGRFGQAVGEQVVNTVQARMRPHRPQGFSGRAGGHSFRSEDLPSNEEENDIVGREAFETVLKTGPSKLHRYSIKDPVVVPVYVPRDMSFELAGETPDGGGTVSLWGQGSLSGFRDADVIDGEASTFMLGIDQQRGAWLTGIMAGRSTGKGGWYGSDGRMGSVSLSLAGAYPYAAYKMSERNSVWGVAGFAAGKMRLVTPGDQTYYTGVSLAMAAAGARAEIVANESNTGATISILADGLLTSMKSKAVAGLSASRGNRTRLRLGVEGRWAFDLGVGAFVPRVEASLRHDAGDGENGLGAEIGGGIGFSNRSNTLFADISGRTLVMNRNSDFQEWGTSATIRYDPKPHTDRGLSVSLGHSVGTGPAGDVDKLMTATAIEQILGGSNAARTASLNAEAAYGLPVLRGRMTGTPLVGYNMTDESNEVRVGWRLTPEGSQDRISFELDAEIVRREQANENIPADHALGIRAALRW